MGGVSVMDQNSTLLKRNQSTFCPFSSVRENEKSAVKDPEKSPNLNMHVGRLISELLSEVCKTWDQRDSTGVSECAGTWTIPFTTYGPRKFLQE